MKGEHEVLKEYVSEAVSLLTEAALGKPVSAGASCHPCGTFVGYGFGNCLSCGADKKRRYKVYLCNGNYYWCLLDCISC